MNPSPRLIRCAGALVLAVLAAAGCTDATDNAVGTITYTTPDDEHHEIRGPRASGCHALEGGAETVENNTTGDLWLYFSADCQNEENRERTYLQSRLTDNPAPGGPPWRSFTVVG